MSPITQAQMERAYVRHKFLMGATEKEYNEYSKWCEEHPEECPVHCPVVTQYIQRKLRSEEKDTK